MPDAAGIRVKQIGIFTATRWEFDAVRRALQQVRAVPTHGYRCLAGTRGRHHVILVQTGIGPDKAASACRQVCHEYPLDLAVSAGVACALMPAHVGDLLIGTDVMNHTTQLSLTPPSMQTRCAGHNVMAARHAAEHAGLASQVGRFVSTPSMIWRAADKRMVAQSSGAIGLDMESAALGQAAAACHVPFLIVRAVSDLVDEELPLDFNLFLHPRGWVRGGLMCAARPIAVLRGLGRLRGHMRTASERTSAFFGAFLEELN